MVPDSVREPVETDKIGTVKIPNSASLRGVGTFQIAITSQGRPREKVKERIWVRREKRDRNGIPTCVSLV
jgi:hypothetical protein